MTMKLYSWDLSPYSARVRMQIYAKGLTDIAIEQPPTYGSPKFYEDHPIGRIPLLKALDRMIGRDGFACLGRVTLADCALVPALFFLEAVLPGSGFPDPIAANANVAAYRAAIQREEYAARILVELHRGLEERRELIRSGAIEKIRAARDAAREAAEGSKKQA
jgi:glutathione S-transferase